MELLQLQYFQVIARIGSISQAAKELHISQPALSQTLKRLEQEVGTPLFDRTGKGLALNVCGEIFQKHVGDIFSSLENAGLEIQAARGRESKKVKLCMMAASMLLPDLYQEIKQADPSVLIHVVQKDGGHLPEQNELVISSEWEAKERDSCRILLEEEIRLALPDDHPLVRKPAVYRKDLEDEPFISLSSDSSLTKILSRYFSQYDFEPNISACIDNPDIMRKLLASKAGLGFIPVSTWDGFSAGGVVIRRVEDMPMKRVLILSWNPVAHLSSAVQCCRDVILDYFSRFTRDRFCKE